MVSDLFHSFDLVLSYLSFDNLSLKLTLGVDYLFGDLRKVVASGASTLIIFDGKVL